MLADDPDTVTGQPALVSAVATSSSQQSALTAAAVNAVNSLTADYSEPMELAPPNVTLVESDAPPAPFTSHDIVEGSKQNGWTVVILSMRLANLLQFRLLPHVVDVGRRKRVG